MEMMASDFYRKIQPGRVRMTKKGGKEFAAEILESPERMVWPRIVVIEKQPKTMSNVHAILMANQINGHHLRRCYGAVQDEEFVYLISEYFKEELYTAMLHRAEWLASISERQNIARQMLKAVSSLHRKNKTHRDIDLTDFLLSEDGSVKLSGLISLGQASERPDLGDVFSEKAEDVFRVGRAIFTIIFGIRAPFGCAPGAFAHGAPLAKHFSDSVSELDPHFRVSSAEAFRSQLAHEFFESVLHPEPRHRASIEEALAHPWLANEGVEAGSSPTAASMEVATPELFGKL
jgi:serine/threonine protein kinase